MLDQVDFSSWPEVPEAQRPKKLYVNKTLDPLQVLGLLQKGWELVDVRLLPGESDADRAAAVKAWLEGARQGSITVDPKELKHLELEARIVGLIGSREGPSTTKDGVEEAEETGEADIDAILSFTGAVVKHAPLVRRAGRPRGSTDKGKRRPKNSNPPSLKPNINDLLE